MSKITWISHRGLGDVENTKEAFDAAVAEGFKYLETDLRVTRDGHLVLCHDDSFVRLGGPKETVDQLNRAQIQQIPLGEQRRSPMFFDEFIERYAGLSWTLDIKPEFGLETVKVLYAWAIKNKAEEWLQARAKFLFWEKSHQDYLLELLPEAVCYARKFECYSAALRAKLGLVAIGGLKAGTYYAAPVKLGRHVVLTKKFVQEYQKRRAKIVAFLPENLEECQLAIAAGVDEILTNGKIIHLQS